MTLPVALPTLTDDCSNCAALCCVAYPFDADEDFALLKRADIPCPNLSDSCLNCTVHADLLPKGFGGCVAYQCAGAGQRVTQELFEGETWRDDPDLLEHMTYALRVVRPIHEALLLLQEVSNLPIPASAKRQALSLITALCPDNPKSVHDFEVPEVQDALADVPAYLQSLAPFL
ncbi:hypothetical protein [Shimia sagamensis]|uniref:Flagellin N-methylase n=1 Tax=Shimia sagamensis TaxID=1566352 RepID=A0ABY1NJQ9_9RHOB|nr:hypothetical protein [Shimia sagamensis]SMP10876.1 hypothetical protein SAMN06265373_102194 [Shimia sagamensis]